ncbi:MarR family winged helix-turn-helix transcriptional regulator [Nocardia thailandica]|uniref:MarR family winged helix-turn-helix transcriptional regulator n=1 Tax=Nocardia thailandica TaxID=257275 RepID=A0ABW6PH84_9NOCA|nr:MarR family transcriptional regulator [Nocardia thailandica]
MSLDSVFPRGLLQFPTYAFGRLHKALHAEVDGSLGEDTSLRGHWVLTFLEENPNLTQQQVADALAIDRSEVVRLIDSLERADLVVRTRDPDDRRKYRLTVTGAGRDRRARTDREIHEATARVLHRLDPAERAELHRLALKAIGEAPPPS